MKRKRQADGFAMIEVLIAIVILAFGLMAGSRMQILGLGYTLSATSRSYATMAANDIMDRMRLNPAGEVAYVGFDTSTSSIPDEQNCEVNLCNQTQRANQDLRIWSRYFRKADATDVATVLPPDARGSIEQDGAAVLVTVSWNDQIAGEAEEQNVTVSGVLR